jgi:hypothetical protein
MPQYAPIGLNSSQSETRIDECEACIRDAFSAKNTSIPNGASKPNTLLTGAVKRQKRAITLASTAGTNAKSRLVDDIELMLYPPH